MCCVVCFFSFLLCLFFSLSAVCTCSRLWGSQENKRHFKNLKNVFDGNGASWNLHRCSRSLRILQINRTYLHCSNIGQNVKEAVKFTVPTYRFICLSACQQDLSKKMKWPNFRKPGEKVEHEQSNAALSFELYFIKLQDKSLALTNGVLSKCPCSGLQW